MKLTLNQFRGECPITGSGKLPLQWASSAVNSKLTSDNLESFPDIGNPFQLTKAAPINSVARIPDSTNPANYDWLQWSQSEVNTAVSPNVDAVPGPVPNDATGRIYITGLDVPRFTNSYYATDPSQRGSAAVGAYPYVTQPLGVPNPTAAPGATAPNAPTTANQWDFAGATYVSSAIQGAGGVGYAIGDALYVIGGTFPNGFTHDTAAAQIIVTDVDATTGAITETSVQTAGLYALNAGPGSTTLNQAGLSLPAASITLTSTANFAASGSVTMASSAAAVQTVSYTGISGNTLTGCSGGTGNVTNGTPVQPVNVTLTADYGPGSGGGSGATFLLNVLSPPDTGFGNTIPGYAPPGWAALAVDNGAGYYEHYNWNDGWETISTGQGDLAVVYSTQNFSLKTCSSFTFQADMYSDTGTPDLVLQWSGQFNGSSNTNTQVVGPTLILDFFAGTMTIYQTVTGADNGGPPTGTPLGQVSGLTLTQGTRYRVLVSCVSTQSSSNPGFNVTATLYAVSAPTVPLATLQNVFTQYGGEQLGFGTNHRGTPSNGDDGYFSNIPVNVQQPAAATSTITTNYVYTWVQQTPHDTAVDGPTQESGPSAATADLTVYLTGNANPPKRTAVTLTIPAAPAVGIAGAPSYIIGANLYRLVEDTQGDENYTLVNTDGPIPVSTSAPTTYVDSAQDTAIGPTILPSFNPAVEGSTWLPPPADLHALVMLPNAIAAGISGNLLCLSAQGFVHAWPLSNQYAIDTNGVGLAAQQTTAFLMAQGNPYTAFGDDPAQFTVTKEPSMFGCASKRSISTHRRLGAIFASSVGLTYFRGQGDLGLITIPTDGGLKTPFSYEQWQALNPASINGVVLEDSYFFSYETAAGVKGSYKLDLTENGSGLTELDFHVTCWALDPLTGLLYFCPDLSVLPINGSVVGAASNIISQWEGSASGFRQFTWEHDDALMPYPVTFTYARVRALDYNSVFLQISNENGVCFNAQITSPLPFVIGIPQSKPGSRWNVQVKGTSTVNDVEIVTTAAELSE